ncbi:MAG TPA: hypothetical protein VMT22_20030, partial [Terriglobales bacterium]|nr:hypothetical protein [Terriglobales bacterium]
KALSVQMDQSYLETHNLADLAERCSTHYKFLAEALAKDDLAKFDMFDQVGRYGAAAKFDPLSTGKEVGGFRINAGDNELAGAWIWTPSHLHSLDRFCFNARGYLDFNGAGFPDAFVSILKDDKAHYFVETWTGPIPVREVLIRDNTYFSPERLKA